MKIVWVKDEGELMSRRDAIAAQGKVSVASANDGYAIMEAMRDAVERVDALRTLPSWLPSAPPNGFGVYGEGAEDAPVKMLVKREYKSNPLMEALQYALEHRPFDRRRREWLDDMNPDACACAPPCETLCAPCANMDALVHTDAEDKAERGWLD